MALFDDIKKKVADTTQGAVKATKDLADIARLNSQISDAQGKIEGLYRQIGKLYFETCGEMAAEPFGEMCAEITAANAQIAKLQAELQVVKGLKRCPNCGADIPMASGFCGKCGTAVESPAPEPAPVEAAVSYCVHCGAVLENGAVFCGGCGQKQTAENQE